MVRKAREQSETNIVEIPRPTREPEINEDEQQILREALKYLVFKHGHLLVPTSIREEREQGSRRWIMTVALRYPTGFEGEIGDLLYDGQEFTFLTPPEVRKERGARSPTTRKGYGNGMSIELPLYRQEKRETCALACLRMVLAAFGTHVPESDIVSETNMEEGGTLIEELERIARLFGLIADIQERDIGQIRRLLNEGKLAIAYIDRAVFDLTARQRAAHTPFDAKVHAVVPVRVTDASITFHDPLPPRVSRRSIPRFREAHQLFDNACVVCSKPENV